MVNISSVGEGKVVLIAGGGRVMTDIAARFTNSNKDLDGIIGSEYDKNIVKNIISSGHMAATEFDYFVFGIEGYSRTCETQLVRKRIASYLIKSGRKDKGGKRSFDVVLPDLVNDFYSLSELNVDNIYIKTNVLFNKTGDNMGVDMTLQRYLLDYCNVSDFKITYRYDSTDLLNLIETWYKDGVELGYPEEDLRYMKPQATEFKAIVGMNAHALLDWFKIRCCNNAQDEIRDLANKMKSLVKEVSPDLFEKAGANCVSLGYCPENRLQNKKCIGKIMTHEQVLELIKDSKKQ